MNYTYAAMNRKTGVTDMNTASFSPREAEEKARARGYDMTVWVICRQK